MDTIKGPFLIPKPPRPARPPSPPRPSPPVATGTEGRGGEGGGGADGCGGLHSEGLNFLFINFLIVWQGVSVGPTVPVCVHVLDFALNFTSASDTQKEHSTQLIASMSQCIVVLQALSPCF